MLLSVKEESDLYSIIEVAKAIRFTTFAHDFGDEVQFLSGVDGVFSS